MRPRAGACQSCGRRSRSRRDRHRAEPAEPAAADRRPVGVPGGRRSGRDVPALRRGACPRVARPGAGGIAPAGGHDADGCRDRAAPAQGQPVPCPFRGAGAWPRLPPAGGPGLRGVHVGGRDRGSRDRHRDRDVGRPPARGDGAVVARICRALRAPAAPAGSWPCQRGHRGGCPPRGRHRAGLSQPPSCSSRGSTRCRSSASRRWPYSPGPGWPCARWPRSRRAPPPSGTLPWRRARPSGHASRPTCTTGPSRTCSSWPGTSRRATTQMARASPATSPTNCASCLATSGCQSSMIWARDPRWSGWRHVCDA